MSIAPGWGDPQQRIAELEAQIEAQSRALEAARLALAFCKPEITNSSQDSDSDRAFKQRALSAANEALAQIEAVKEKGHADD